MSEIYYLKRCWEKISEKKAKQNVESISYSKHGVPIVMYYIMI